MSSAFFLRRCGAESPKLFFTIGSADYTDSLGRFWKGVLASLNSDFNANGSCPVPPGVANVPALADSIIYYQVGYGHDNISLPAPPGRYSLIAHYCSCYLPGYTLEPTGLLDAQGNVLVATHNIYDTAGGQNIAYQKAGLLPVTADSNGLLVRLPYSDSGYTIICGIELTLLS